MKRLQAALLAWLTSQIAHVAGRTDMCHHLGFKGECQVSEHCFCVCFDASAEGTYVDAAYFGELGYELMLFTPVVYYYQTQGLLRRTAAVLGSQPFYVFSPNHTEVNRSRHDCQGPYSNPHLHMTTADWNFNKWQPPPYRQYFQNDLLGSEKPILVVHNKYNVEWKLPHPENFIDIPTLLKLFGMLKQRYKIVYNRPDPGKHLLPGFSSDFSGIFEWDDFDQIRKAHPDVILFQDLLERQRKAGGPGQTFNELQMMVHAECKHLISVQGGSSILASHFAGVNIIFAKAGREAEHPDAEFRFTYPRLGDNGNGTIVNVNTYDKLVNATAQYMLA